ncbi:MAG: LacI family DNA-binding transcriptional regulator [Verrucomicrobia bacterium]|nr:LacI family DNA-binding transcriptional regulator [Verrucomicrobiota bacterium]
MDLAELASELGVSPSTISRALNRPKMVSPTTRLNVLGGVKRFGYKVNHIARSLRTLKTKTIGVIVPHWKTSFPRKLLELPGRKLYQVTMASQGTSFSYLEAIMRAYIGGSQEAFSLSSGLEGYFLRTYYFNRGVYHLPAAGVTHLNQADHSFSAYRFTRKIRSFLPEDSSRVPLWQRSQRTNLRDSSSGLYPL